MGCTTSLQASVAHVPVVEIDEVDAEPFQDVGFAPQFAHYHASSSADLKSIVSQLTRSPDLCVSPRINLLHEYWHGSDQSSTYKNFATQLFSIRPRDVNHSLNSNVLNEAYRLYKKYPFPINTTKWPPSVHVTDVSSKIQRLNFILQSQTKVSLQQVANNLYLVSPK